MYKKILVYFVFILAPSLGLAQGPLYWQDYSAMKPCTPGTLDFPSYVEEEGFMVSYFDRETFYTTEQRISIPLSGAYWERALGSELLNSEGFQFSIGISNTYTREQTEGFWITFYPGEGLGTFSQSGEIIGEFELFSEDSLRLYLLPNGYREFLFTQLSIDSRYDDNHPHPKSEELLFADEFAINIDDIQLFFTARVDPGILDELDSQGFSTALCDWFDGIEQKQNTFNQIEFKNLEFRSYLTQEFISPLWLEEDPIEEEPPTPAVNYCNSSFSVSPRFSEFTKTFTPLVQQSGYQYSWDFGDGTTSTEFSPTHTYSSEGGYTTSLTVTSSGGSCVSKTTFVGVSATIPPPPCSMPSAGSNTPPNSSEDNSKNYTKTITYDQSGSKFSSAISYSDELGRTHQTIEYTEGADYAHANQTVYDEFGRPALSTKTAPVNQGGLGYINEFVKDASNGTFNWQDVNTTDPLIGTGSNLGQYFRNGAIEDHVAQTGRPYTQTEYLDQPGAAAFKTARPGDAFGLGSTKKNASGFSMKAGSELDYIFGYYGSYLEDDSGQPIRNDNKDVTKSISTDEDGNTYVSFVSASGLEIATCRSGETSSTKQISSIMLEAGQSQIIHTPHSNKSIKVIFKNRGSWTLSNSDVKLKLYDAISGQDISGQFNVSWNSSGGVMTGTVSGTFPEFVRISVGYKEGAVNKYARYFTGNLPGVEIRSELDYTDWTFNYYNLQGQLTKSVAPKGVNGSFSADPANQNDIVISKTISGNSVSQNSIFWTENLTGVQNTSSFLIQMKLQSHINPNGNPGVGPGDVFSTESVTQGNSANYFNGLYSDIPNEPGQPIQNVPNFPDDPFDVSNIYRTTIQSEVDFEVYIGNNSNPIDVFTLTLTTGYTVVEWQDDQLNAYTTTTDYSSYSSSKIVQGAASSQFNDVKFKYVSGTRSITYSDPNDYCAVSYPVAGASSNPPEDETQNIFSADLTIDLDLQINTAPGSGDARTGHYITYYNYDDLGRVTSIDQPDAGQTRIKYNTLGLPRFIQTAQNQADNVVQYRNYDANNRLVETGWFSSNNWSGLDPNAQTNYYPENSETTRFYYDSYPSSLPLPTDFQSGYESYYTSGMLTVAINENSTRWYGYDYKGRVIWEVTSIEPGNGQIENRGKTYHYDYFDRVVSTNYNPVDQNEVIQNNQYDQNLPSQLASVTVNYNGAAEKLAAYRYYQTGQLKRTELFRANAQSANPHQGIDYLYTVEGWLKAINAPVSSPNASNDPGGDHPTYNCFQQDLFAMSLDYYSGDYKSSDNIVGGPGGFSNGSAQNSYTGNVMAQNWYQSYSSTFAPGLSFRETQSYNYSYDYKNQLTGADYGTLSSSGAFSAGSAYKVSNITYDANGNLLSIRRKDRQGINLDDLTYSYASHKNTLTSLSDGVSSTAYPDDLETSSSAPMAYNASGQLTTQPYDGQNGYTMVYNPLGQITQVLDGTTVVKEYRYGPLGQRVVKKTSPNSPQPETELYFVFSGQIEEVYGDDGSGWASNHYIYGNGRIGIIDRANQEVTYEIQDHLGHVRARFTGSSSGHITLASASDYYPFGMVMPERNYSFSDQEHGFQGAYARRDHDTHWDEFLLRNYDSRIGQFISVDPYLQYASPFVAMGNNPINVVDPTGGYGDPISAIEFDSQAYLDKLANDAWEAKTMLMAEGFSGEFASNICMNPAVLSEIDWRLRRGYSPSEKGNSLVKEYNIWTETGEHSWYYNNFFAGEGMSRGYLKTQEFLTFDVEISFNEIIGAEYYSTVWDPFTIQSVYAQNNGGDNLSLAGLYSHFQIGGGKSLNINMSSVDFGGATQGDLGLTGMNAGDVRAVQLFRASALTTAGLAFGRVNMMANGNNQFSIVSDNSARFDFAPLIDRTASLERNVGNVIGAGINYNIWLMPITPLAPAIPLIFGGPFDVNFNGTTTIPQ